MSTFTAPPTAAARRGRGIANRGPVSSAAPARRPGEHLAGQTLTGRLDWVDALGRVAVLRVQSTSRRVRGLRGRRVELDLSQARVCAPDRDGDRRLTAADLLPGETVTVKARLPRDLGRGSLTVTARSIEAHDHSA